MNKLGSMTVVAVATGLAACGGGAYGEYALRTKTSEALNEAAPVKLAVAEYLLMEGKLPADRGALPGVTLPIAGQMSTVDYADGAILIRFGDAAPTDLKGRQVAIVPYRSPDSVRFTCGRAAKDPSWESLSSADGPALTTVDAQFLPASCR